MSFDAGSIIATLELDRDPFQAGLAAAQAEGAAFADDTFNAQAGVDTAGVATGVATADAELDAFAAQTFTAKLNLDTSGMLAALAAAKTGIGAASLAQLFTGAGPFDQA